MRQQRAPVALLKPQPAQISTRHQHLSQQLPRRERNRLPVAQFLQDDGVAAALQARKYLFKESHAINIVREAIMRLTRRTGWNRSAGSGRHDRRNAITTIGLSQI